MELLIGRNCIQILKRAEIKIKIIVLNFFACPSLQFILLLIWVVGGGNTIPEPNIVHV